MIIHDIKPNDARLITLALSCYQGQLAELFDELPSDQLSKDIDALQELEEIFRDLEQDL